MGYKEWGRHDTRSHTTETGGASSSTRERRRQDSGKKHKSQTSGEAPGKFLNITCEVVWDVQKVLDGKKASLCKTDKTQTKANDKVCDLNRKTEKALKTLAKLAHEIRKGQLEPWRG